MTLFIFHIQFFHNAGKAFQRPVGDPDGIADAIVDLDLYRFSTPNAATSSSVSGIGLDAGPTKPVQPRVLRTMYHDSSVMTILIKYIAGEYFAFYFALFIVFDLGNRLGGDLHFVNQVMQPTVFNSLFNVGCHLILITGIGVNHIPFCALQTFFIPPRKVTRRF